MSSRRAGIVIMLLLFTATIERISSIQQWPIRPGARVRTIDYDPAVPIVDRLLSEDDVVVIQRDRFPGITLNVDETLDAALEHAMLHDTIVLAHGLVNSGTLIEQGTWIRGTVNGSISKIIKAGHGIDSKANRVTFWHQDGELFIKNVHVRAGTYPVFDPSSSYLLLLGYDESRGPYLGRALKISTAGVLTTLMYSDGQTQLPSRALYGHSAETVIAQLRKRAG